MSKAPSIWRGHSIEPAFSRRVLMTLSLGSLFRTTARQWFGPFAHGRKIVKVTIRDQKFAVIRELTSERDLAAFRDLWSAMVESDPRSRPSAAARAHYKLDIQWTGRDGRLHSSRWFYYPGGFVELLAIWRSVWVAPLYRMLTPDALETTFGLDPL